MKYPQKGPTKIHIDNLPALEIINNNTAPTERTRHMDIRFFCLQDWREDGDIIMEHIRGVVNMPDTLTKNCDWILHSRHCRRMLGHYNK